MFSVPGSLFGHHLKRLVRQLAIFPESREPLVIGLGAEDVVLKAHVSGGVRIPIVAV